MQSRSSLVVSTFLLKLRREYIYLMPHTYTNSYLGSVLGIWHDIINFLIQVETICSSCYYLILTPAWFELFCNKCIWNNIYILMNCELGGYSDLYQYARKVDPWGLCFPDYNNWISMKYGFLTDSNTYPIWETQITASTFFKIPTISLAKFMTGSSSLSPRSIPPKFN